MKRLCRAAALMLAAALLAALLGGCGVIIIHHGDPSGTSTETETTPPPETSGTGPVTPHHREIKDYAADAAAFLASVGTAKNDGKGVIIASTKVSLCSGDDCRLQTVSAALHARNDAVSRALDISLLFVGSDETELADKLREADSSGLYYADLLMLPAASVAPLANEGLLLNLRSLPFLNTEAAYFNASSVDAFTAGKNIWAVAGMASLDANLLPALYFNRQPFEEAKLDMPYTAVYEGIFTWDTFYGTFASLRASDDGLVIAADAEDGTDALFAAAGGRYVTRSVENVPTFAVSEADAARIDAVSRLFDLPCYVGSGEADAFFGDDRIAFYFGTAGSGVGRGTSATKWGLLPLPALSESDAMHPYRALMPSSATVFASPKLISSATLTGRLVSALNAASYGVLLTADAEGRSDADFRDLDSAYMFVEIGFGAVYDFTAGLGANDEMLPTLARGLVRRAVAGEDLRTLLDEQKSAIDVLLASFVP